MQDAVRTGYESSQADVVRQSGPIGPALMPDGASRRRSNGYVSGVTIDPHFISKTARRRRPTLSLLIGLALLLVLLLLCLTLFFQLPGILDFGGDIAFFLDRGTLQGLVLTLQAR